MLICESLHVLAEAEKVLSENPRWIQKTPKFVREAYNYFFTPDEEWREVYHHSVGSERACRAANTSYEELFKTAAEWLRNGSATVGILGGWEAHITLKEKCKDQHSQHSMHFSKIIWYKALVYQVHRAGKHQWLHTLEDAVHLEIKRVGAALKIAKSELQFENLRTSLVKARSLVRFVCGHWRCLHEVTGVLKENRLEETMYDEFGLLRSSFEDVHKEFLCRAVLCQLSPGMQVMETEEGRPAHLNAQVAFQTLRTSTKVLSSAGTRFDAKVKEAEEFLLSHKNASTECQKALNILFVKEHINTIAKDAIAKLQAVVDEVLTPDGVKKMKEYFGNLREIDRDVLLVPSNAGCPSGLTNKTQSVNAKAFTDNVQSEAKQFMHTIFEAVMSTAVKNIDDEDWTALHENLLLSEKYFAGCEKDPTLTKLLSDHDQRGLVKHKNGEFAPAVS